jgi:hypothetical protein
MSSKPISKKHQKRLDLIATYLRELRLNEGLTQNELTHNLHRNTIIRAENSKNLTLLSVFELVDAMGISLQEFFLDIE